MVNILIHQFEPGGAVVDEAALEQFQQQWGTYQKLVEGNCFSHKEIGGILQATLQREFARPFSLLDLACGDASEMREALAGTTISHYHGIDLSEPALELAAGNLKDAGFEVDLDHRDFVEALKSRPEPADVSWCSLSIHHLQTPAKLDLLRALRRTTGSFLMIYEPTLQEGEARDAYLERFRRVNQPAWTMLNEAEWDQIYHHVTTCDFPETAATWLDLGRTAGFGQARDLFAEPTGFYRLYRYDP